MDSLKKTLKKMSGLKTGYGFYYMTTYRENYHMSIANDEVIVQLKKALFPYGDMPDEITVTVEWNSPSQ